ncbi:MAG: hypothetical protein RIM99_10355 [Cyclobacteriaceae bacterium]
MKKHNLTFLLSIAVLSAFAQVFSEIPGQNAIHQGNVYYLQKSQEAANNHIRGIIGQGILWDAPTDLWQVNNGGKSSNDFSMIAFGNGGDIIFYNRLKLDGSTYTMTNTQLDGHKSMVIDGSGFVGIGTTSPGYTLDVAGNGRFNDQLKLHGASEASSTTEVNGQLILTSSLTGLVNSFGIHQDGVNAHSWIQSRHESSSATFDLILNPRGGDVGIGTTTPTEKLEVNGTIRSKEVKVEASPWPDYVFADNYNLPSLEALEKFIKSEGHLPEVPSAKEVEENGIALGEMNALLLKKIEELTLHMIEMKKENIEFRKELETLKNNQK